MMSNTEQDTGPKTEQENDEFEIVPELCLGLNQLPPDKSLEIGDRYCFGSSLQMAVKDESGESFWFSVRQSMSHENKHYLMLSYPPSQYDSGEKIPLVLVELTAAKRVRTLDNASWQELLERSQKLANQLQALDLAPLRAVLGKIPDWSEVKHRL